MIRNCRNEGLKCFYEHGNRSKRNARNVEKPAGILALLDITRGPNDMAQARKYDATIKSKPYKPEPRHA